MPSLYVFGFVHMGMKPCGEETKRCSRIKEEFLLLAQVNVFFFM